MKIGKRSNVPRPREGLLFVPFGVHGLRGSASSRLSRSSKVAPSIRERTSGLIEPPTSVVRTKLFPSR